MSTAVVPFNRDHEERRPLPFNLDVEQALLGAILNSNDLLNRVGFIAAPMFFEDIHRRIFDCAEKMIEAGKPATPITMKTFLGDGDLGGLTVSQYLARLAAEASTTRNVLGYAQHVRDLYLRREAIARGQEHLERLYDAPVESKIEDLIGAFEDDMTGLRPSIPNQSDSRSFGKVSKLAMDQIARSFQHNAEISGVRTGLRELDNQLGGLQAGDFIVLGGRPGSGKTSLGALTAREAARDIWKAREHAQVLFFTIEMPDVQIGTRMLCDLAGVPPSKVRKNTIDEDDFGKIADVAREMQDLPIEFDESPKLNIAQISARSRQHHRRKPVKLIVVDYLQLMGGAAHRKNDNRVQELSEITAGMKALAKEIGCPVLALSQLSRKVDERDNKRPMLADLRDSGSIEQDADVVMFCYREEYYLRNEMPLRGTPRFEEWERKLEQVKGHAEIIIGKNRHGPQFTVNCGFVGQFTRFENDPPAPVEQSAEQKRERKPKEIKLPADASILFGVLKSMSISHVVEPVLRPRMEHPKGRLINAIKAREVYAEEAGLQGEDPKKIETAFRNAYKALRAVEFAYRAGDVKEPFIYLSPEKVK